MQLIADFHLHSHYSRATSRNMNLESAYRYGKLKGINVIGTGDFTHPLWFGEIQEKLEPAEKGLFKLKKEISDKIDTELPESVRNNVMRFILTVEISNIYKRHDVTRRLHNVIVASNFNAVSYINEKLNVIGNLKSDGRPILGLDSYDLLKISLESDPDTLFFPAHIWTPWFAMFGSKSGFNSVEEAFGDLADEIVAVETGLSSDPFMNWRISDLDGRTLVSNSDAHSPRKLGREANLINANLNYKDIIGAIRTNDDRFVGTIEFYPEEGKYHFSGHQKCGISLSAKDAKNLKFICPKCGKKLVLGVEQRVDELANRPVDYVPKLHKIVEYIVPLEIIIADVLGVKSVNGKKVQEEYINIINHLGDEFNLIRKISLKDIKHVSGEKMALAIDKVRKRDLIIEPGYDGVYGVVKIFSDKNASENQLSLLS